MQQRKRFVSYLLIAFLSFVGLLLLVNTFDPSKPTEIFSLKISLIAPFFILCFLLATGIFGFILANRRRGILFGLFITSFLFLSYLHANNIFYTLLLLLIVVLVDLLFWNKK